MRRLEQEIAKICRKVVKELLLSANSGAKKSQTTKASVSKAKVVKKINVTSKNLEQYLGVYRYDYGVAAKENQVGQVTGLAWTSVGGELLTIEAALIAR